MAQSRYQIFQLSARAVMSYAVETEDGYSFDLSVSATEKCRSRTATHEQDSNALFFQTMCVLRGDNYAEPGDGTLITDLSDAIFYMDFAGVFDRSAANKKQRLRQEKARAMFRPEGVGLDFGSGPHRYVAFERSGSMNRQARLSFIRADLYDAVRRRIMLGMDIDYCQLSKLYAYNGLMLSSGTRIDGVDIDRPHRVIVVDNPTRTEHLVPVITVEDDGKKNTTRKYHRVEKKADVEVTCFDGEGLISPRFAAQIDRALCGGHVHTSFQIRLPYVKGMLHQVDFHTFLTDCGTRTITDLWGVEHRVKDVDVILTRSMCKGLGWICSYISGNSMPVSAVNTTSMGISRSIINRSMAVESLPPEHETAWKLPILSFLLTKEPPSGKYTATVKRGVCKRGGFSAAPCPRFGGSAGFTQHPHFSCGS